MLHLRRFGSGRELVALHGFSLTGEQFSPSANPLDCTVIAPDLPGHGMSRAGPYDVDSVLADIETVLETPGGPRPLLGYSQGGRLALLAAVEAPDGIAALVLVSATAGIRSSEERKGRADLDAGLAERIEAIGLDAFVNSWTTAGITSLGHLSAEYRAWDRAVRSENTAAGLVSALRGYGQGAQPPVWDELDQLSLPVLLIVGQNDKRYRAINEEMETLISGAELQVISDAGHNPIADQPEVTFGIVSGFLDRHR